MKNKFPERFSFHELKSMLSGIKSADAPVKFIGKDIAMLGRDGKTLQNILQTDTPYIMEDCRMGFVKSGSIRLMVNLIEREYGAGTFAFISAGSILQINGMSEDFDLCGMMLSDERLKAAMGKAMPTWCSGNATFFTVHPGDEDAATIRQIFSTIWDLINKERFPDETLNGLIHAVIHYYSYLKDIEADTAQPRNVARQGAFQHLHKPCQPALEARAQAYILCRQDVRDAPLPKHSCKAGKRNNGERMDRPRRSNQREGDAEIQQQAGGRDSLRLGLPQRKLLLQVLQARHRPDAAGIQRKTKLSEE